ncbi:hypothetical protein [Solilutibacter silvestris]|uniref:Uncharacterized protein n=1 Tax=Solilutibacter silvestris TaxID=1645665 RepID=A0A2K1Q2C2_9GAMM|nr:hypothetical protein [Lysobacter silvestris]PNS09107.1 hypothetical protein Lysil_0736 [Lysobacter silvestris]
MSAINNPKRLLIGLLLAPLVPGLLMLAISLFGNPSEGLWSLKLIAMFAYPAMLVVGLPLHLLFQRLGWNNVWPYLLSGAIAGIVVAYYLFPSVHGFANPSSIAIAVICAFFGAITAATFWWIARPSRP